MQLNRTVGIDGVDLCGGEGQVGIGELFHVVLEVVGVFRIAVAVAVGDAAAFGSLALDGEHHLHGAVFEVLHVAALGGVLQVVKTVLEPLVGRAGAGVVVGRGTEGIKFRTFTLADDFTRAVRECVDGAGGLVERELERLAFEGNLLVVLAALDGGFVF